MADTIQINGEAMIYVKGAQDTAISALSELGLTEDRLTISIQPLYKDVNVEAWGMAPVDVQRMNCVCTITMNLIQFDMAVLRECIRLAKGGSVEGRTSRAGALLGNGRARFDAGWSYVGLNIASPVGNLPWRFYSAYLTAPIGNWPLGVEKSVVPCTFKAIPYTSDAWQGGQGASENPCYDHVLDA